MREWRNWQTQRTQNPPGNRKSSTLFFRTNFICAAGGTADTVALEATARKGMGVQISRGAPNLRPCLLVARIVVLNHAT